MKCPNCEEEVKDAHKLEGVCPHCGGLLDEGESTLLDDEEAADEDE